MKRVYWAVGAFVVVVACSSAGRVAEDAGRVLMDAGRAMDSSANAQVGEWVDVVCDQEQVVTSVSGDWTLVTTRRFAIVDVDPMSIQVETCANATPADADRDGCPDAAPDGGTCTSTGALPETCSYGVNAQGTRDGKSLFGCSYAFDQLPDPALVGLEATHSRQSQRIRYRTVGF